VAGAFVLIPLWEMFFHQLLGEEGCQSRFLLTSQDVPADIEVPGLRYPQRLHIQPIPGFSVAAQQQLFFQYGFAPDQFFEGWAYLLRIGQAYEGHPLALQVILGEIMAVFEGDIVAYWQTYRPEIAVVEAAQQVAAEQPASLSPPQLDCYSQRLRKAVRTRIEATLRRLQQDSEDALLLLCMTAIYREAMPESFLLSPLQRRGWSTARCYIALDTLLDRYLLEVRPYQQLRQHPLIRSVALSYLEQRETEALLPEVSHDGDG